MVSLAFAIAASANFPVLFMSVLWKDCTTRGAVVGGFLGLISSVGLTIVSPSVWEATLGQPEGLGAVPVHLAGAVLDGDRFCRHLRRVAARQQRRRHEGPRGLRDPAGTLRDRLRRLEVLGTLRAGVGSGARCPRLRLPRLAFRLPEPGRAAPGPGQRRRRLLSRRHRGAGCRQHAGPPVRDHQGLRDAVRRRRGHRGLRPRRLLRWPRARRRPHQQPLRRRRGSDRL